MGILYFLLHIFGCPEEDLIEEFHGKQLRCKKCNRVQFVFKSY